MGFGFDDILRRLPVRPELERAFSALPHELNELGYDDWGFHPQTAKHGYAIGHLLYRYFRTRTTGIENIPEGRVLLIANHSGQLPLDGMVIAAACLLEGQPPRAIRAMVERMVPTVPYLNELFSRSGAVVGDPTNCRNLLSAGNAILVFPEGARGCGKLFKDRYHLTRFGRGFMRLALQTDTPIVPISVVGAEESIPSVMNLSRLAALVGAPYVPIPPHLPLLGPLAYLPLPTRFYLDFGEPLRFEGRDDDEDEIIDAKVGEVSTRIQAMIDARLASRPSVF
ncbi:MAG: acyltransferase family protein [Deltaproteobacteria bacterium]|nr:acyltransferase family protein [Deltaproteobacteria bacterium]MCB9787543.1 acyltransferase family protein [Deltaproteobacteria bacterium]